MSKKSLLAMISTGKTTIPIVHHATYRLSVRDNGMIETFNVDEPKYLSLCIGDSVHFDNTLNN